MSTTGGKSRNGSNALRGALLLWCGLVAVFVAVIAPMNVGSSGWIAAMIDNNPRLLYEEALILQSRDPGGALERIEEALDQDPYSSRYQFLAFKLYYDNGSLDKARQSVDRAIVFSPPGNRERARYLYHRGLLENRLGNREAAISDWSASAILQPDNLQVITDLERVHAAGRNYGQARGFLKKQMLLDGANAQRLYRMGDYFMQENAWSQAVEHLESAHQKEPENAYALRGLGDCYKQLGRLGDAQYCLEQYLLLRPDDKAVKGQLRRVRQRLRK
jgi:tetratricopeptide (TPR) repeat protein